MDFLRFQVVLEPKMEIRVHFAFISYVLVLQTEDDIAIDTEIRNFKIQIIDAVSVLALRIRFLMIKNQLLEFSNFWSFLRNV